MATATATRPRRPRTRPLAPAVNELRMALLAASGHALRRGDRDVQTCVDAILDAIEAGTTAELAHVIRELRVGDRWTHIEMLD